MAATTAGSSQLPAGANVKRSVNEWPAEAYRQVTVESAGSMAKPS